jgi:hypothetical protein
MSGAVMKLKLSLLLSSGADVVVESDRKSVV